MQSGRREIPLQCKAGALTESNQDSEGDVLLIIINDDSQRIIYRFLSIARFLNTQYLCRRNKRTIINYTIVKV